MVNSDGSEPVELTNNKSTHYWYFSPVWFPDGSKIAYVSGEGIYNVYVMDNIGENVTKLYDYGGHSIAWSPDGKYLLNIIGTNGLFQIDSAGNRIRFPFGATSAAWSPDGTKIAIITTISEGGLGKYVVALTNLDGANFVPLPGDEFLCNDGISWSP